MAPPKPQDDIGVPVKLLREFENKKVTIDTATGEVFTGILFDSEENMSCTLTDVKATLASGAEVEMASVYVKGAKIRYIGLPPEAKERVATLNRENRPPSRGGRGGRGGRGSRGGGGSRFGSGDRRRY